MKLYFITFRSVTFAQRGERILTDAGIRSTLIRTPKWMEEQGCGYALRLWTQDVSRAVKLLRQNRVILRRVYVQRQEGQMEEIEA